MKYHLLQLFTNSYIIDVAHYNFIPQSSLLDSGLFLKLELINICIHMCMFVCLFISLNIGMYVHSFIIICFYLLRSKHTVIIIRLHCSESISIHFSFLIAFTHSLLSFFFLSSFIEITLLDGQPVYLPTIWILYGSIVGQTLRATRFHARNPRSLLAVKINLFV